CAGLATDPVRAAGAKPAAFLDAYKTQYGSAPRTSYALYGVQALQVILAAIEKSDGSRKSVRDQVFEGAGVTIPAGTAVLGKEVHIDPATGDVSVKDITIELEQGNKETFLKAWPVS